MKLFRSRLLIIFKKIGVYIRDRSASFITLLLSRIKICKASFDPSSTQITYLRRPIQKEKIDERLINLTKDLLSKYTKTNVYALKIAKGNKFLDRTWNKELTSVNGEHYFLIQILCQNLKPKKVIEIGTFLGASSRNFLRSTSIKSLYSFDLVSWRNIPNNYLIKLDEKLLNKKFRQFLVNLEDESNFEKYKDIFINCDFILLDGPKNKTFESKIFYYFLKVKPKKPVYVLVDDIYLSTMVDLWNQLPFHKIDLSFIGHWSGSGLFIWE